MNEADTCRKFVVSKLQPAGRIAGEVDALKRQPAGTAALDKTFKGES
jgi:hypothetical protein